MLSLQASRPISMKKEGIQSRNRKLSAKARKKHSSFTSAADIFLTCPAAGIACPGSIFCTCSATLDCLINVQCQLNVHSGK